MATPNPFDLLGDDDAEDPSLLIAAHQQKIDSNSKKTGAPAGKQLPANKAATHAKLPTKPAPPAQAVRESKSESARGGRAGGRGRGGAGSYRDSSQNNHSYGNRETSAGHVAPNEVDAANSYERRAGYGGPRGSFRGGRRGGFNNGEVGEGDRDRPRRPFDRHSGTGFGNETRQEGAGRGNWATQSETHVAEGVVTEGEKVHDAEKSSGEDAAVAANGEKEASQNEVEEKEPEDKEMTLEEYEKILEEKRKALQALKTESSRKVDAKEFESMQALANKKMSEDVFVKLGSEKDKKKELAEKEERAKKSMSINEFLKPAEGERYYNSGRGRGRGRGPRGGGYGGGSEMSNVRAPAIEDPGQFPTLGTK